MTSQQTPASLPLFLQIAQELEASIKRGDYDPGERLPSTRILAEQHNVSPMAISDAIHALEEAGIVAVQARSGAFVQPRKEWKTLAATPRPLRDEIRRLDRELSNTVERLHRLEDEIAKLQRHE